MPVHNVEIASILNNLADLLEIEGANPFRVRAYRNAAETVQNLSRSVADMVATGEDLSLMPGIGEALAKKLKEIVETGQLSALQKEEKRVPPSLRDLLKIPMLGPKRVHLIHKKLKIIDRNGLEQSAKSGKLRKLPGFGEKIEQTVLKYFEQEKQVKERMSLAVATQMVQPLLKYLRSVKGVKDLVPAGSYRRGMETVGDVDILATCTKASDIMTRFVKYEDVKEVLARGQTRSSVVLRSGLQVDLRVVPASTYGAALHYFTGSKVHNIAIRTRGVKRGLKINEYGVFRGKHRIGGRTEEEVFKAVGLPYIEPELRENRGEIEAAEHKRLPQLVKTSDIRGDLHVHTNATDGHHSLADMANAAKQRGYEYLGIADHSRRIAMAHGLDAARLAQQIREIDRLNDSMKNFRVLKSIEVDILEDGSLDLPDDILKELDIVTAAIHSKFNLSQEKQTERIIRAMDNPYFNILAHPTGRVINERKPYEVDMERVIKAAKDRGCFMELNAHPARLDLNDVHCKMTKEMGVKIVIATDGHSVTDLGFMHFGVGQARRGWIEPSDVLNTRSWAALSRLLKRA